MESPPNLCHFLARPRSRRQRATRLIKPLSLPVAGTGPFTWKLSSGTLPSGLCLSSAGVISGTLDFVRDCWHLSFTIQATDSTSATAKTTFTLGVYSNLGDNCANISFDVPGSSTPLVAINDLGTGSFLGYEGGLYPNGSNVQAHIA